MTEPTPAELIAAAESAFSAGDPATAEQLLNAVLADPRSSAEQVAEAESDLAVVTLALDRPLDAEAHLLRALARVPTCAPALENLATLCRSAGDLVEATHWARRLTEADPTSVDAWSLLVALLRDRGRHAEVERARGRALSHGVEVPVLPPDRPWIDAAIPPVATVPPRVLVLVDHFHPSLGGSERLAEAAGVALAREGFSVGVATRAHPERRDPVHRGMEIHEIVRDPERELAAVVAEHGYDALVVFADPASWPIWAALSLPEPRPRTVAVPCINGGGYTNLTRDRSRLAVYREAIGRADVLGVSSRTGADARLAAELSLPAVYLPNGSEEPAVEGEAPTVGSPEPTIGPWLRAVSRPSATAPAGDGDGDRTLLMVANMWPEKNHLGLLSQLAGARGRWRLELIGEPAPARPDIAAEVRRRAADDPRIVLRGRAEPAEVAAAMEAADVLLLPSLAEATPIVLLEAMSRSLPWIASPACGSAHDHAGGLIVPVSHFAEGIDFLLGDPEARATLARAGRSHWQASYRWEVIGRRYADILRGVQPEAIDPPQAALDATEAVRARFYDWRVARRRRSSGPPRRR